MTKKLEELFNVNNDEQEEESQEVVELPEINETLGDNLALADKIDQSLPLVKGLQTNDKEMDELAVTAKETFDNLMDLGMNMEARYSGRIFEVASQMLGHALTAKNAKIEKKLKMIELQLKKARLDQQAEKAESDSDTETGDGMVLDRNELIASILKGNKD